MGADCGKMCSDCAFRTGTDANNDVAATEGAISCLQWDGMFNCHTGNFSDAGQPCAGFLYAKKYLLSGKFIIRKPK